MAFPWLEVILGCLLIGALIASLGLAAYFEYKRYRAYKVMLKQQERFYTDARIWIHVDLYERGVSEVKLDGITIKMVAE